MEQVTIDKTEYDILVRNTSMIEALKLSGCDIQCDKHREALDLMGQWDE